MAYCRFGPKCDVYMYLSGAQYHFHLSQGEGKETHIHMETPKSALRYLDKLIAGGYDCQDLRVARNRLVKEIKELTK